MFPRSQALVLSAGSSSFFRSIFSSFSVKSSSSLAQLRKATGHPFALCREALAACKGDYSQALAWLQKEGAKRGIAKAEKLKSRPMSQGLLGMISKPNCVAVVEINCETDFVARNQNFQSFVAFATESLFKGLSSGRWKPGTHRFSEEALKALPYTGQFSNSISDALVATMASVGENMAIPRGVGMALSAEATEISHLMAYCHATNAGLKRTVGDVHFGKYVAFLRYRHISNLKGTSAWQEQASRVCHQLCQHIVGMSPRPSLALDDVPPAANPDDERCLLRQPFLFDETISVGSLLEQNEILLDDFVRVECGVEEE
ncbi:Elongation factor Ts mitochondrial [Taenia crassiceps]|uniref:Elongation factor Ts, mitochondrial n=1 Tax=Taenia crassiceps TaxID=6207 RepID=A0ABR4QGH3_9CEST